MMLIEHIKLFAYRLTFLLIMLVALLGGCGSVANKWDGDLDAVFAYKPDNGVTTVKTVFPSSKCASAGLKEGDIILAVDGQPLSGLPVNQVLKAMRGPTGSYTILSIQRDSEIINFEIERMPLGSRKEENK